MRFITLLEKKVFEKIVLENQKAEFQKSEETKISIVLVPLVSILF